MASTKIEITEIEYDRLMLNIKARNFIIDIAGMRVRLYSIAKVDDAHGTKHYAGISRQLVDSY